MQVLGRSYYDCSETQSTMLGDIQTLSEKNRQWEFHPQEKNEV